MPDDWLDGATSAVEEGASANAGTAPAGAVPSKLQLPCQYCLVDHLGGFAVGT